MIPKVAPMRATRNLLVILIAAAHCQAAEHLDSLYGDKEAQSVVAKPTKVQAYRLADNSFYKPTVQDYKMLAGPVAVDDALAKSVGQLLLDEKSYLWDVGKGCDPIFGVRLEFVQGDKSTDIFFCFECDILQVYVEGKPVSSEDFDDVRPQLVKMMQKIFPKDKAIQGLKANR